MRLFTSRFGQWFRRPKVVLSPVLAIVGCFSDDVVQVMRAMRPQESVSTLVAGQPSITRTTSWRLRWTSRPGAWNSPQRNVLGRVLSGSAETEQLEPTNQVARQADHEQPRGVGGEVGERYRGKTGVFQSLDVALDVRAGAHRNVDVKVPFSARNLVVSTAPVSSAGRAFPWTGGLQLRRLVND